MTTWRASSVRGACWCLILRGTNCAATAWVLCATDSISPPQPLRHANLQGAAFHLYGYVQIR